MHVMLIYYPLWNSLRFFYDSSLLTEYLSRMESQIDDWRIAYYSGVRSDTDIDVTTFFTSRYDQ